MASGIFTVLDDIAMLMDDMAMATKVSINKTAPILADDLAVNAQKASGFSSADEIDVLIKITKGSLLNKIIILPVAFLLSAFASWLIVPILVLGGVYLALEGAVNIHKYVKQKIYKNSKNEEKVVMTQEEKVKSAIITDFILSIEIIIISLGSVLNEPLLVQVVSVSIVSLIATVGVYGVVALLVRMDDVGFHLIETSQKQGLRSRLGEFLVRALPEVIKVLSVIGTIAMLLVAGGILTHNLEFIHHFYDSFFSFMPILLFDMLLALVLGYIVFAIEQFIMHKIK